MNHHQFKPGDIVHWRECPPYLWQFANTMVRAVEGDRLRLAFIYHSVPAADCEISQDEQTIRHFEIYGAC